LSQQVEDVVEFSFAIVVGGKEAIVEQPKLVGFGIDVYSGNQPDAFNQAVSVATVLAANQFDAVAVALIEHRVIEEHIAAHTRYQLGPYLLPELTWGKVAGFEEVPHVIVPQSV